MLTRELAHRGRNLLAVVQSIAGQTLAGERPLDEARRTFIGRLQALSRTYSSLTDDFSQKTKLTEIVRAELSSFKERATVGGPEVMLDAKIAQTFTLIIHELTTNAAKYGSLSVPRGRLSVAWEIVQREGNAHFVLEWMESNGPPVGQPKRRGFGSTLVSLVAGAELKCVPQIEFRESGLRYHLDAPLSAVQPISIDAGRA